MPCSGGRPVYRGFLLSCQAQSKKNVSCEFAQEGTECPSRVLRTWGASPGKAAFVPGGWSLGNGLHHFTRVLVGLSTAQAVCRRHFLGQGRSHRCPCLPGNATAREEPTTSTLRLCLSLHSGLPAFSRAPREPPTPQKPSYFSIFLWGIFFSLMY